jgi:integrase
MTAAKQVTIFVLWDIEQRKKGEGVRVEPIRDKAVIKRITEALKDDQTEAGRRRYLLFCFGLYLGRRVSDLLKLKVGDVQGKEKFVIREQKTGKQIELFITKSLKAVIRDRLAGKDPDEYILASPVVDRITKKQKPIDRRTAYRDVQAIKKIGGFPDGYNLGTHTLRKTFGYHYYQMTHDIAGLMKLFNHTKEETTLVYIGIESDERRATFRKIDSMYDT